MATWMASALDDLIAQVAAGQCASAEPSREGLRFLNYAPQLHTMRSDRNSRASRCFVLGVPSASTKIRLAAATNAAKAVRLSRRECANMFRSLAVGVYFPTTA